MLDVEDQVREMLRRRADDVPIHVEAPSGMLRRAWRRIVMAFTGGALVIALVAGGAGAAVRALRPSPNGPASQVASLPPCRAKDLQGRIALHDSTEHLLGSLVVTNVSGIPCSLQGLPAVMISDGSGGLLDVTEQWTDPEWMVQSKARPKDWPVVKLFYGTSASVRIDWESWCSSSARPAAWRVVLSGGGVLQIPDLQGRAPICTGTSSSLHVGPFEPVT